MKRKFTQSVCLCIVLFICAFPPSCKAQIISTFAGTGSTVFGGDGGPATAAGIYGPEALAADSSGNIYVSSGDSRLRKVTPAGIISTVAGNGLAGFSGDGGPATSAQFSRSSSISTDRYGNLYFTDVGNGRIRRVDAAGIITTVAGNGTPGYTGDGGPATAASLSLNFRHTTDRNGNVYVSGTKIRRIDISTGIISYFAGDGTGVFSGDGGPATAAGIAGFEMAFDNIGNLFIQEHYRMRKIDTAGIITTVAGDGTLGFSGDGGPATAARFTQIQGFCVDMAGNIYTTEYGNPRVRKINTLGIITTIAGDGTTGFTGDGGPATAAEFN
jgi:hypothetical protein